MLAFPLDWCLASPHGESEFLTLCPPPSPHQARALLAELRLHRLPGTNPGAFAPWQPHSPAHPGALGGSSAFVLPSTCWPHPVAVLHGEVAGYLASGFKQVLTMLENATHVHHPLSTRQLLFSFFSRQDERERA